MGITKHFDLGFHNIFLKTESNSYKNAKNSKDVDEKKKSFAKGFRTKKILKITITLVSSALTLYSFTLHNPSSISQKEPFKKITLDSKINNNAKNFSANKNKSSAYTSKDSSLSKAFNKDTLESNIVNNNYELESIPSDVESTRLFPPAFLALLALIGLGVIFGILSFSLYFLRRRSNPLYWQLSCWLLVALGILLRPFVVSGIDPLQTSIKGSIAAGIIALVVFPGLMRLLNRLKPEPGVIHVALPFGLGFFLDVAQVIAKTYVPIFTWLP
jgi:hypothetical protein